MKILLASYKKMYIAGSLLFCLCPRQHLKRTIVLNFYTAAIPLFSILSLDPLYVSWILNTFSGSLTLSLVPWYISWVHIIFPGYFILFSGSSILFLDPQYFFWILISFPGSLVLLLDHQYSSWILYNLFWIINTFPGFSILFMDY